MADRYPPVQLAPPRGPGEPVRVGFVSGHFRHHSVWKIPAKGWLGQLDRKWFRIFGYDTGDDQDTETVVAAAMCERFVRGPLSIDQWRAAILADAPHVLIYPDTCMDGASAQLAALRLAPVQCTSWGHPETSGYPTLDYFLSSDPMEPPAAQEHYSETLIRLPNLSTYYEPLEPPAAFAAPAGLQLRPAATVFWSGQSLFKYLPRYDQVFPRIAREVPDSQFVFIDPKGLAGVFLQRLDAAFAAHGLRSAEHCIISPALSRDDFLSTIGQCDIVLDSIG